MATFVIDTNKISDIKSDISRNVLPKITSCYNTVVSVKSNLPKEVTDKKYLWSSLPSLYRKIDNIYDDVIKINNLLYKTIEKMNDAEARMIKWNSLKTAAVDSGRKFIAKGKQFASDVYDDYQDVKNWFQETSDAIYETGCEVVEKVENWVESLTWEDVENFFKTTAATIVVACQSLLKGLMVILLGIVDLAIIVGTIVVTPFTAIADGVNYLLTGESGGYTSYYWDGAMDMVADAGSLYNDCCNWLSENNPSWVNEYSLIEVGGVVDQIIQGIGTMIGIIGITVVSFGTATPAALAATAGSLGFAKGTADAWAEGKDAVGGLIMGAINGSWEAFQYYVGGKIGTSVFKGITSKIASPILKKLAVSGIRIGLDSATGAVEVPFQSVVSMIDTRVDDIEGNELSWDEAWEASGGWIGVIQQTAIAGVGSLGGEVIDFGKAFKNAKVKGTTFGDALDDIYIDDLDTIKNNKENPFGKKKSSSKKPSTDQIESNASQYQVDSIDDAAIAMANYRTNKGIDTAFRFADDSQLPDINSNFWTDIKNPDKVTIDINGRQMSFDEAISYKKNYDLNMKDVDVKVNESLENIIKNNDSVAIVDDGDIAMANYRANKGIFSSFSFDDASTLPDLDSNFWKNIEHPEQTFVYVDGKNMTFNDALIYRQSYESSVKHIDIGKIDNLAIENLDYADIGIAEAAAAKFASSAKRYVYTDTNDFIGLNKRISDNGLYHFTDATDAIMDSGYIKATAEGWNLKAIGDKIAGKAYGRPKTFFFEGIPEVGAFATNIDTIPLKTTAVKINPTSDILDSSKLRIRNLDDGAITWDGRFDLTDQNPTKQYFVLTVDEGKLKYINVPESVYNSYDNTAAGKQLAEFISNKKNIQAIKDDYLVNTSLKGTNAQISDNSKIISLYDRSKTILKDKAGAVNLEFFKNPKKVIIEKKGDKYINGLIKEWRSYGTVDADVDKNLKEIFFDDDYVIGIHRTPDGINNDAIYNEGLLLTGHGSSGVANSGINLGQNIEFFDNKTDFDYEKLLRAIRTASEYKSFSNKGNAMIVRIPKSDIDNFDKILTHKGTNYVLKPDYVIGDVSVDDLNIKSGRFKTSIGNVDLKANELNELIDTNLKLNPSLKRFNSAKVFSNDYEIAIKYEDPKQYLYCKLKDLADSTGDAKLQDAFKYFKGKRNIDKDYGELYNVIYPYLDANDMDVLSKMNLNSYNGRFTNLDQEEMFLYSRATGPALAAYERGTSCKWKERSGTTVEYDGTNKKSIQDKINFYGRQKYGLEVIDIDEYVERIDNIIKKAPPLEEDTILYRGVNSLFFDGNELDLTNLKEGQIINDKATISTSLLKDKAYGQNDIMLEILAPKGTKGAYIESFVGGYGQQEFLLGRNTKFKVISEPDFNPITGKTTIKVEIVPPDTLLTKLKNTGANISNKFKSIFTKSNNKNNFTVELEENVGAKFTSPQTDKLVGDYPNRIIDSNNVIDKMNLRNFRHNDTFNQYDKLFNKFNSGVEVNDFIDKLERKGLLSTFDSSVKDIDELYARGQGPGVIHHDVDHVERVMLFAMYMGDELQLNGKDMGVLIQAAKHHDIGVYNGHDGHASLSAMEAINNLQDNYPQPEINKIAAVIDYHEVIKKEESLERFAQICSKYNVPESEYQSLFKVANILKDADAIDRTRFRNNLDTSYFRNTNEANILVKTSYQMQEISGKIALEQKINDNVFTPEEVEQINNYRLQGVPDYVIYESYETYDMWGYFNTPDDMIKNWMSKANYS